MMPRLHVGDVSVAKPVSKAPALQQVLLFHDPDHPGRLRLHRFVRVDNEGRMVTRGDANHDDDSSPVTMADLEGVAVLRVPYLALPVVWLREGRWLPLALTAAGLLLVGAGSRLNRGLVLDEPDDEEPSGGPAGGDRASEDRNAHGPSTPRRRRSRPARAAAGLLAAVTLLGAGGAVVAGPAWADFVDTTTNPASSLAAATSYRCSSVVLSQNPTLYHQLDETSGSVAADSSGNGRTGTLQTGYSRASGGICSNQSAVTLNGTSGYLSTSTQLSAPNTFTVQTWFKTTTTRGGRIIGFGSSPTGASTNADRHVYMATGGQLLFGVQTANNQRSTIASTGTYNDGSWHLVTASLSTGGMKLFVDGALVSSRTATTSGIAYTGSWRVGYDNLPPQWTSSPTSDYFGGTVAQVAVYPSALSNQVVADLYAVGLP
jgi:hypothetical protein